MGKITVGDILLAEVENSPYFKFLYKKLLINYGAQIFNSIPQEKIIDSEVIDLLKFADIFSKSNVTDKINLHRNLAQEIVTMLSFIFEYNGDLHTKIVAVQAIVLKNVSNYAGLDRLDNQAIEVEEDFLTALSQEFNKSLNRVSINSNEFFSDAQAIAIRNLVNMQFYSFSAPTSMGKTYIIRNFLSRILCDAEIKCIALVLPTKALINEIEEDLIEKYEEELKNNDYVVITIPDQIKLFCEQRKVLIFTPERLLQALNENSITKIDYLFIDEAQKIFENDERTPYYYKILEWVNSDMPLAKVFFSSPYANNPDELLKLIANPYKDNRSELAKADVFDFSPVVQKQFIVYENGGAEIYNIIEHTSIPVSSAKKSWQDIIKEQSKRGATIIYCKSRADVLYYATEYAKKLTEKPEIEQEVTELITKIKTDIHEDYYLIPLLRKGIAFHMGIMPSEIRKSIETLAKQKKGIDTIFCTSTLLEGVNLPAVNIFILSHHKSNSNLSTLEFKNLVGRAGRIRYSLWGNAFLLALGKRDSIQTYKNYLTSVLPNDKLKPEVKGRKCDIVTSLFDNNYKIVKKKNESYSDLKKYVMYRNILAVALKTHNTKTAIYGHYKKAIEKELIQGKIQIDFDVESVSDLRFAPETIKNIKEAIKNDEVVLPHLTHVEDIEDDADNDKKLLIRKNIENNGQNIYDFYKKLSELFQWNIFEPKDGIGSERSLQHYAWLTARWIAGQRLSRIIIGRMYGYKQQGYRWDKELRQQVDYSDTSISDKNAVITEVMGEIENELKFSLSNYVAKFVKLYESVKGEIISNTIADYIDYGTMNDIIIEFQKMGLSRELAKYIFISGLYVQTSNGGYLITDFAKLNKQSKYKDEAGTIAKNLRFIFRTVHQMKLNPESFYAMQSGIKTVELRLYDGKRKQVKIGDVIEFTNNQTTAMLKTEVLNLYRLDTFKELFTELPSLILCGVEEGTSIEQACVDMREFYPVEKEQEFGVLGIELKVLEN